MAKERKFDGKQYEVISESIVNANGVWVHEQYFSGHHSQIGEPISGATGNETVRKTLIPNSLVDPSIKVNGMSNASLNHLIAPEFRYLVEQPAPQIQPLERLLDGIEINLSEVVHQS